MKSTASDARGVAKKIHLAKDLLKSHGEIFYKNKEMLSLLSELREAIEATEIERIQTGLASECAKCGSLNKDCCGRGIELRYSVETLLINLLLGVNLPEFHHSMDSCYFLTPTGCCLKARDVFCVNYLCKRITDNLTPMKLGHLRELEGREATIIFRLEGIIKRLIHPS